MLLPYSLQTECRKEQVTPTIIPTVIPTITPYPDLSPTTIVTPTPTSSICNSGNCLADCFCQGNSRDFCVVRCHGCTLGSGYCSVDNLMKYFSNEEAAIKASMICQQESGSNPFTVNKGCLTGKSVDYSIGLFQINLLAHCPEAFSSYGWEPPSCKIGKYSILKQCEQAYLDPETNILKAVNLSGNGRNWCAWKTASNRCTIDACN